MATRPVKLKLQPRSTMKAKNITRLAGRVIAGDGIDVAQSGGSYTISVDWAAADDIPLEAITGASAYTTGDLVYANTSTSLGRIAASTTGYALLANGAGVAPSWQGFIHSGTGAAARSWLTKIREPYVSVKDFGATGDGATDDTVAFQNAAATGMNVYIPAPSVSYYLTDEIECATNGQEFFGDGPTLSVIEIRDNYNLSAAGAPFNCTCGEQGPKFRDFLIRFEQPDTNVRANLVGYPPAIYAQATPRFVVRNVRIEWCEVAIDMRGNSGGAIIDGLETSALTTGIDIDGSLDTVRINNFHHFSFGPLTANQLEIFLDDTVLGIKSGRCDDLKISNSLTIGGRGMRFYEGSFATPGSTFGSIVNHDFDGYGGLIVEAGRIAVTGGNISLNSSDKRGIYQTGGNLSVENFLFLCSAEGATNNYPVVHVNTGAGPCVFQMQGCLFSTAGVDLKHVHINTSGVLDAVLLSNYFLRDPNTAYTEPTIHIDAGRATIIGNRTRDKGSGAGTFILIDTDNVHRVGLNAETGWTNTFPTASSGVYDTTIVTTNGTQELDNKTLDSSVGKGTWTASGTWTLPAVTLGGAITYGGVTLSNAVTGTGNMVLATSPTLTTPVLGAATATTINGAAIDNNAWASFTPGTPTAGSGAAFTSASAVGTYKQIGKTIWFRAQVTVTTAGAGADGTGFKFDLPATAANYRFVCACREISANGFTWKGFIDQGGATTISFSRYDNTSTVASGSVFVVTGEYEAA